MKTMTARIAIALALASSLQARAQVPSVQSPFPADAVEKAVHAVLDSVKDKTTKAELKDAKVRQGLVEYMRYLMIDPADKNFKSTLQRLLSGSTQLAICADYADWACLERKPQVTPVVEYRQDTAEDLGTPVVVNEPLKMEYWFTTRWAQMRRNQALSGPSVAEQLGKKIRDEGKNGVFMAIYGIDDKEGSMAPVFNAVADKVKSKVPVFGVFDVGGERKPDKFLRAYDVKFSAKDLIVQPIEKEEMDFSYVNPKDPTRWVWGRPDWMNKLIGMKFTDATVKFDGGEPQEIVETDLKWLTHPDKAKSAIRLGFQYKDTLDMIEMINASAKKNEEARARIEFPMEKIMHNKFVVFDNGGQKSVWSGTANVARTCMGDETNSNMSIFIRSNAVAEAFMGEFREMYEHDTTNAKVAKAQNLVTGRFHTSKRPNTKRYFKFNDGHELRVHFAPTDDGEHRAIIPMLLSAKKGDKIRVSMFGAGGIEFVRAMQLAASRGAQVQVLLDLKTGSQGSGWMKSKAGNLYDANPYSPKPTPIEIRLSTWLKNGQNHHKSATLTRFENGVYRTEALIVGSQNWSASGNDMNDENMVTLRHLTKSIAAGDAFNKEFDENLWALAQPFTLTDLQNKAAAIAAERGDDDDGGDEE